MPLPCCKAVESHSLGKVPRNTLAETVAPSNHILPKAAARRLALPSQRKPSRYILRSTVSPHVAAAECALAVRAAQRRASCSQLKRALVILGNAWSAVDQHVREKRVRRPVLQQRRLLPALRRVAVPLLAVQPLRLIEQFVHMREGWM